MIKYVKTHIAQQGYPEVESCYIYRESTDIVCLIVEMKTKYNTVTALASGNHSSPSIYIGQEDESIPETLLEFFEYANWDIFSAFSDKSSIGVTLVKSK